MEGNRAGDGTVGDTIGLQLDKCASQVGWIQLRRRCRSWQPRFPRSPACERPWSSAWRSSGFWALRIFLPRGIKAPALPLQAYGRSHVQAKKIGQQVCSGLAGWGQHGIDQDGLAVQAEKAPFGLQLRYGELPVEAAACGSAPGCSRDGSPALTGKREPSCGPSSLMGVISETRARLAATAWRNWSAAASTARRR